MLSEESSWYWLSLLGGVFVALLTYLFLQLLTDAYYLGTNYLPAAEWYPYFLADPRYRGHCWCMSSATERYWSRPENLHWWFTHPLTYVDFQRFFFPLCLGYNHYLVRWQRAYPHLYPEPFNNYLVDPPFHYYRCQCYLQTVHALAIWGQNLQMTWAYLCRR